MRSLLFFLVPLAVVASSCHSSYQSRNGVNDDVYYSSKSDPATYSDPAAQTNTTQPEQEPSNPENYTSGNQEPTSPENKSEGEESRFGYENSQNQENAATTSESYSDEKGNTYVTNNYYYEEDDYYDYAYTARIRRFHRPCGWSYYDSYYTNSYWYDYNPNSWGVSIYLGYNWWGPSYYNYYSPYYGHYWGNYPYYSPYSPYQAGYYNGYQNGYWNGYYAGLYGGYYNNPYYYNSYDNNTHYHYGPRGSGGRNTRSSGKSIGQLYESNIRAEKASPVRTDKVTPNTSGTVRNADDVRNNGTIRKNETNNSGTGGVKPAREVPVKNNPVKNDGAVKNNGTVKNSDSYTPANNGGVKPSREINKNTNPGNTIRHDNAPVRNDHQDIRKNENLPGGSSNPAPKGTIRNTYPDRKNDAPAAPEKNDDYYKPRTKENNGPNDPRIKNNEERRPEGTWRNSNETAPVRQEKKSGESKPEFRQYQSQPQQNMNNNGGNRQPAAPSSGERKPNRPR